MAIKIGIGLSVDREPLQAAQEALQQARISIGQEPISLAIVFGSIDMSSSSILREIKSYLPNIPLLGASGAAVILNQGIFRHGLLIIFFSFLQDIYFNTACAQEIKSKTPLAAGWELGENLLYGFKGIRRDLSMLFCDGLIENNQDILNGLQEKLGRSFPIVGGSAADNLRFSHTYVYFNQDALSDAACGIIWGGKLNFGLGTKHGWYPLGKPRFVTKAAGNIVYEIDGVPAAKLYEEYLACDRAHLQKELNRVSTLYPLGVYLPGEEEYLLRNILSIGEDGSLLLQGDIAENSQVRLMIGTKESCLNAARQASADVKKGLGEHKCILLFVFDSFSRYVLLGRQAQEELRCIKEVLGEDVPLVGIYTYGEQAPLKAINYQGRVYAHNQTITMLGIGG